MGLLPLDLLDIAETVQAAVNQGADASPAVGGVVAGPPDTLVAKLRSHPIVVFRTHPEDSSDMGVELSAEEAAEVEAGEGEEAQEVRAHWSFFF